MTDTKCKKSHAEQMKLVRSKDTRIERLVNWALENAGVTGYARNVKIFENQKESKKKREVDFYFEEKKLAIFVHGCHWHVHDGCKNSYFSNSKEKHREKLIATKVRDKRLLKKLHERGFRTLIIWECSLPDVSSKKYRDEFKLRALTDHQKTKTVMGVTLGWLNGFQTHLETLKEPEPIKSAASD